MKVIHQIIMRMVLVFSVLIIGVCQVQAAQEATYTFPTTAALQPFATFDIADFNYSLQSNQIHIDYDLPPALVGGSAVHVSLSGSSLTTPILLTGAMGNASCTSDSAHLTCNVAYTGLTVDSNAVQVFLNQTVTDPSELINRSTVAKLFGDGPIGVIIYNLDPNAL